MRLDDKVAVITGSAGGQGRAAATLFAEAGAKVVVADIDEKGADEVIRAIRDDGNEAIAVRVDVSREAEVAAIVEQAVEHFGRLDVLFNNAGVGYSASGRMKMASVVETPEEDWDAILAINLKGVAMGCKHAIPVMEPRAAARSSTTPRSTPSSAYQAPTPTRPRKAGSCR